METGKNSKVGITNYSFPPDLERIRYVANTPPARVAQQEDDGARKAAHLLGPNQRGGGSDPTVRACSVASMPSHCGNGSLVQLCAVSALVSLNVDNIK